MTRKLLLENKTCSRCCGSGNFSYCQMYGSVCFKCHGDGVVLTKRGRAAQIWLNAKKMKPLFEVAIGDWILSEGVPGMSASTWIKIDEIDIFSGPELKVSGLNKRGERHTWQGNTKIKVHLGKVRDAELAKEALEFQATLTLAGTVRKVKAKRRKQHELETRSDR